MTYADEDGGLVPGGMKVGGVRVAEPTPESMYDRLGVNAIRAVVDQFYDRVFRDPDLEPWFGNMSAAGREKLRRHQVWLVGQVLGGPVIYSMDELEQVHQRLEPKVTPEAFGRVVEHLLVTLADLHVPADVVEHLSRVVDDVRPLIVGHVDD